MAEQDNNPFQAMTTDQLLTMVRLGVMSASMEGDDHKKLAALVGVELLARLLKALEMIAQPYDPDSIAELAASRVMSTLDDTGVFRDSVATEVMRRLDRATSKHPDKTPPTNFKAV